ncbi:MAG: hypothetical protein RIA08_09755 [Roseovarius sp.]|uniref:DUF6950 family protein n=1 Tax=Roseovarius sp. TaxID=1486281 RepID=UPI0032EAEC1E
MRAGLLHKYIESARAKRFRPGEHDCALFAAGWVALVTGQDHSLPWQGYRTLEDGKAMLAQAGYADHVDMAAQLLEEIPVAMARTGDLAVVEQQALGIVSSDRVFALHVDGLTSVSLLRAERAFRV